MAYGKQEGCQQIVYQKWRVATEFYVIASRRLYEEGKLTSADLHDAHFQSTMGNFSGNSRLDVMESRSWNMDPPRGLVELNQRANYDDLIKQGYSKEQADLHMGIWSALAGMTFGDPAKYQRASNILPSSSNFPPPPSESIATGVDRAVALQIKRAENFSTAKPDQSVHPRNLHEQYVYEQVIRNPEVGKVLLDMNNDPRFSPVLGFQKMEYTFTPYIGKKISVHYSIII